MAQQVLTNEPPPAAFPQTPDRALVEEIRSTALELHHYRSEQVEKKQWGITKLYNEYFAEPTS